MYWTIQNIYKYCQTLASKFNLVFDCPIKINKKLIRVNARVKFINNKPYVIEFSNFFLNTATDESIKQIIKHEFCHWLAYVLDGKPHGHDDFFQELCGIINCEAINKRYEVKRIFSINEFLIIFSIFFGFYFLTIF